MRLDGRPHREGADADPVGSDHGRKGRLQALHAQGDPRAAAGRARHAARPGLARGSVDPPRGDQALGRRPAARRPDADHRLRNVVARRVRSGSSSSRGSRRSPSRSTTPRSTATAARSLDDRCLSLFISQSGETADTLAAEREAKSQGAKALAICNVRGSMLTRECDGTIYTHAGPEIGVASTKAFTSQIVALALLALKLGRVRGTLADAEMRAAHPGPLPHPGADGALPARRRPASSSSRRRSTCTATSSTSGAA